MLCKMKHHSDFYNKREDRVIFVFLSPFSKSFYINHCVKSSLKETYRHNIKGRRLSTKRFLNDLNSVRPCLFVLEELQNTTNSEACNYLYVWLKIFLENEYISFNHPKTISYAEHLYFQNQELYETRKHINPEIIMSCNSCAMPIYNNQICNKYKKSLTEERRV